MTLLGNADPPRGLLAGIEDVKESLKAEGCGLIPILFSTYSKLLPLSDIWRLADASDRRNELLDILKRQHSVDTVVKAVHDSREVLEKPVLDAVEHYLRDEMEQKAEGSVTQSMELLRSILRRSQAPQDDDGGGEEDVAIEDDNKDMDESGDEDDYNPDEG